MHRGRGREDRAVPNNGGLSCPGAGWRRRLRRTALLRLTRAGVAPLLALATAFAAQCGGSPPSPPARVSADSSQADDGSQPCAAMWREGLELRGVAGNREVHAYFDMAPVQGAPPNRISGVVLFPQDRGRLPLADAPIGLAGLPGADACAVLLTQRDGDADIVWTLRIEGRNEVRGHRTLRDRRTERVAFSIVPETPCTGAGGWRTFSSPDWPITLDYPAAWVITSDHDDIAVECPSVTRLARGGWWLSFEQGRFEPVGKTDPYWFSRSVDGVWRVGAGACSTCPPARRSERNGITILQGAAGEHRLYRPGVGYLGPGAGITRYLFIAGDRWVSLDVAGPNGHYADVGEDGGAVLLEGDAVGDRLIRSIRRR